MIRRPEKFAFSELDLWLLPFAGLLVPGHKRLEWAREWHAELWHLRHGRRRARSGRGQFVETLSLLQGLLADAAWLRLDWLRESVRGSALECLGVLLGACLICAAVERVIVGSWHSFSQVLITHFLNCFLLVAVPAVFAAMVTYPLRPLRCDDGQSRGKRFLSARARWSLFLGAKIALTLTLGFLASVVATVPVHQTLELWTTGNGALWGADWVELLLSALTVTLGLRWALLNQERRCQKCLRMLGQPTRVGPPSRNFLDWSGTELTCADGHGRLHVAEMQGSWCWYDLWVERTYLA